jgi:phage terminase Nu1 subunit (DNA packaging protein)
MSKHDSDVDAPTLARFLRCDVRHVSRLAEAGLVVRTKRARFALVQSVGNVVEHYRNQCAGLTSADGKSNAMQSNAALKEAQRRLVDLKYQRLDGQLISMPEIEMLWGDLIRSCRTLFLSLPMRAQFEMTHLTDADRLRLERVVDSMLRELAIKGQPPLPEKSEGDDSDDDSTE